MIIIKENGLAAYFEVNKNGYLNFYGIQNENEEFIAPDEKVIHAAIPAYAPVEIRTTGSNTRKHHGGKAVGFTCPDFPRYHSHYCEDTHLGKKYVFNLKTEQLDIKLNYLFTKGTKTVRTWTEVTNVTNGNVGLEYISSFAFTGLANIADGQFESDCHLLTARNGWCKEFMWNDSTLADLGYYGNSHGQSTAKISISNTGTWSTKEYLPVGCFTYPKKKKAVLWQIESNTSWSWELADSDLMLYIRLCGPSELYNSWWKNLKPGESFESAKAAVSFGEDFDSALAEMTAYRRLIAHRVESDRHHPVIFNDYMKCLNADPTTAKIIEQVDAASAAGCEIFCIDAGWYADASGWWSTIGDYVESKERFPGGFKEVFDYIRSKGMRPGLWVEPENIGVGSNCLEKFDDDCFFVRHGVRVYERGRYQFDMRHPKVRKHLTEIIDRLVADYGVEYFKFDYNIDAGVGTECNSDSFGDGLYESGLATISWIDELQAKYPNLIIENCSSGGMRADYMQLQHYSVQSLTDAFKNCNTIQIAAASPTCVIPEQACVWALPQKNFTDYEIASCMVNTMFRRVHLSGETAWLTKEQKEILYDGIKAYKATRHLVDKLTPFFPLGIPCAAMTAKVHCAGFKNEENCYITITNTGDKKEIEIPLGYAPKSASILYPTTIPCALDVTHNGVKVTLEQNQAVVIEIK